MPERSCAGCGSKKPKAELVRFIVKEGALSPDPEKTGHGRGAYICPRRECLKEAYRKKGSFSRALKKQTALPDEDELWEIIKGLKP